MDKVPFKPKESKIDNWDDVFAKKCRISVETFKTGTVTVPKKNMMNMLHEKAKGRGDEMIESPVLSHLVQHDEFGNYLIDGGLDISFQNSPYGKLVEIFSEELLADGKLVFNQEVGQDIYSRINERNTVLKGVFFSHTHIDHTAGILDFPPSLIKKIKYFVGLDEMNEAMALNYGNVFSLFDKYFEIDFETGNKMPFLGNCIDFFGDNSFWIIPTPGHSIGHMSFLINGIKGVYLLTCDASLTRESFDNCIGPNTLSGDLDQAQVSLEKLSKFVKKYPFIKLVFGHEL